MTHLELLSPAKDMISGITAINYGADAVYIGANQFGARASVANSIEDIEKLSNYAHKYYSKVYATVNTIFQDSEADLVRELIYNLYYIGVDAIIIQDMGILQMDIPPIAIFASTQANNYTVERVKLLESAGISRVILARELSLDQIREIKNNTNIELESFVFGALCVSLSGQCYLSQAICSRSANRGQCSQICRHKFNLSDEQGKRIISDKHLLSLKDLNLDNYIAELANAGISSFKIEGRLKDINYVKNITAYFRKKIDEILNSSDKYLKASSGKTELDFIPDIESTFNRNFTKYFIDNQPHNLAATDTPKFVGKFIGRVNSCQSNQVIIDTNVKINNGDGLSYFDNNNELRGFRVNRADNNILYLTDRNENLLAGTDIYRNLNAEFENSLDKSKAIRKISADISIIEIDNNLAFSICDEDNVKTQIEIDINFQIAEAQNQAIFNLKKQLSKSGKSIFKIVNVYLSINNIYFIPIAELNSIRRSLLEKLEIEREVKRPRIDKKNADYSLCLGGIVLDYSSNIMNHYAKSFYEKLGAEIKEFAIESTHNYKNKILMTTRYCIKREIGQCPKYNFDSTMSKKLYLEDEVNKFELDFDCKNCFMILKIKK
jgi:23S rRNA 5-hydroxycytidine C2501 synthase